VRESLTTTLNQANDYRVRDTRETTEEIVIEAETVREVEIVTVAEAGKDTGTESAEEADHLITGRAETSMIHILRAETTEHENAKSATPATDGMIESGIVIVVQDGETTGETIDAEIATCLTTDAAAAAADGEAGIETMSAVREKTETSSLRSSGSKKLTALLQRSENLPQI